MTPTELDYRDAYYSQDASNLSGLLHTFAEVMPRIAQEARQNGKGSDYVAQHPITRMYVCQMYFLSYGGIVNTEMWEEAYRICKERGGIDNGA